MRIISHKTLKDLYETPGREDAKGAILAWREHISISHWNHINDLKRDYPSASIVGNRVAFNIRGNKYRLVVIVKFVLGIVYVRFIGTHAEYDQIDVSTI